VPPVRGPAASSKKKNLSETGSRVGHGENRDVSLAYTTCEVFIPMWLLRAVSWACSWDVAFSASYTPALTKPKPDMCPSTRLAVRRYCRSL
jgi:hypothetical protein